MSRNGVRSVSGRYSGAAGRFRVELRIDVDGPRTLKRVSADYYRDGRYLGSMRVDAPVIQLSAAAVRIHGVASFSWPQRSPIVRITIPRPPPSAPHAPAMLSHGADRDAPGAVYTCEFESPHFRHATLQESYQQGVTQFSSYDTARLPGSGPRRNLSIRSAFAEAGIELVSDGPANVVDTAVAGPDSTWNDAELQAAMLQYFDRLDNRPQWAIWLLHAWSHDDPGIYGLMFDRRGLQRQGSVVFYRPISGTDAPTRREQLYTCVHELGHGFNLLHSWQKSRVRPPVPSRPAAKSWMNYPHRHPGGKQAFWRRFAFEFDELELAHLRHGFEEDVIMGGSPLEGGAAIVEDDRRSTGLGMRIGAPPVFEVGVPVTIAIELVARTQGQRVPTTLGPRARNVDVLIRRPGGGEQVFEPLIEHCHGDYAVQQRTQDRPLRDTAFIHYGKDGFAFDRPGRYAVRARHVAVDGSTVLSNELAIEVLAPRTRAEREISRLVSGNDDIGALMSLAGSAAPFYDGANRVLDDLVERFPTDAVSYVARVVRAMSLARAFKLVAAGDQLEVREPDIPRAQGLLAPVIDLGAVYREVSPGLATGARRPAVAAALTRIGTRRGIPATVAAFVNSRLLDIAGSIASPQMATRPVNVHEQILANWPPGGRSVGEPVSDDAVGLLEALGNGSRQDVQQKCLGPPLFLGEKHMVCRERPHGSLPFSHEVPDEQIHDRRYAADVGNEEDGHGQCRDVSSAGDRPNVQRGRSTDQDNIGSEPPQRPAGTISQDSPERSYKRPQRDSAGRVESTERDLHSNRDYEVQQQGNETEDSEGLGQRKVPECQQQTRLVDQGHHPSRGQAEQEVPQSPCSGSRPK